jgi:hypothetical protein
MLTPGPQGIHEAVFRIGAQLYPPALHAVLVTKAEGAQRKMTEAVFKNTHPAR